MTGAVWADAAGFRLGFLVAWTPDPWSVFSPLVHSMWGVDKQSSELSSQVSSLAANLRWTATTSVCVCEMWQCEGSALFKQLIFIVTVDLWVKQESACIKITMRFFWLFQAYWFTSDCFCVQLEIKNKLPKQTSNRINCRWFRFCWYSLFCSCSFLWEKDKKKHTHTFSPPGKSKIHVNLKKELLS